MTTRSLGTSQWLPVVLVMLLLCLVEWKDIGCHGVVRMVVLAENTQQSHHHHQQQNHNTHSIPPPQQQQQQQQLQQNEVYVHPHDLKEEEQGWRHIQVHLREMSRMPNFLDTASRAVDSSLSSSSSLSSLSTSSSSSSSSSFDTHDRSLAASIGCDLTNNNQTRVCQGEQVIMGLTVSYGSSCDIKAYDLVDCSCNVSVVGVGACQSCRVCNNQGDFSLDCRNVLASSYPCAGVDCASNCLGRGYYSAAATTTTTITTKLFSQRRQLQNQGITWVGQQSIPLIGTIMLTLVAMVMAWR